MLSRGGVQSMFFTQAIVILALSLGGLLTALGILPALLSGIKDTLDDIRTGDLCGGHVGAQHQCADRGAVFEYFIIRYGISVDV